jgi:putative heme iron utilization protein
MRSGRLVAASEEELSDLAAWLHDHPDDVTLEVRFEAIDFLLETMEAVETYPMTVYVPTPLVDALVGVIEDWGEVLSAHNESLTTTMMVIQ